MTQYGKIFAQILSDRQHANLAGREAKQWYLPKDFMQGGPYFVGYEASARLSELAKWYPELFDTERQGRFKARKLNFAMLKVQFSQGNLPEDIAEAVKPFLSL